MEKAWTTNGQHVIFWSDGTVLYPDCVGEFVKIHRTIHQKGKELNFTVRKF